MYSTIKNTKFKCPHCQVVSQQTWTDKQSESSSLSRIIDFIFYEYRSGVRDYDQDAISKFLEIVKRNIPLQMGSIIPSQLAIATCISCHDISVWISREIVFPQKTSIDSPNSDLNEEIKSLYREAASIYTESPKGATALLRLSLQKLMKQIGKNGKNINSDIKELVSEGLSPKIQQALDLVRVVGNNTVHPGQIDLDDRSEIALKLFHILNFIANELITKPKELEDLYTDIVPEETKKHIKQRDKIT